jgi:predicted aspartyl protease
MAALSRLAALLVVTAACAAPRSHGVAMSTRDESVGAIPVRVVGDYLVADLSIDGRPPVSFLVDTGAFYCSIDPELARELDCAKECDIVVHGWAGELETTLVRAKSLRAGPLVVEGPLFAVVDRGGSFAEDVEGAPRIRGILGLEVLKPFVVSFDFREPSLTIAGSFHPKEGARVYPLREDGDGRYLASVTLGGERIWLLLDTGANDSIAIDPNIARKVHVDPDKGPEFEGTAVGGRVTTRAIGTIETQVSGRSVRTPIYVSSQLAGLDGRMGSAFLRHFRVTLDFPREEMAIE